MAKQDDWVRFQVRLPRELHSDLQHYATDSSLNAEIVRRLKASIYMDMMAETPVASAAPNPLVVRVDASDRPISWDEIQERVAAVIAALGHPVNAIHMEVVTPEVIAERRDRIARADSRYLEYIQGLRDEAKAGRAATEARFAVLDEIATEQGIPAGMSLNETLERIAQGEDPGTVFVEEVAKFIANHADPDSIRLIKRRRLKGVRERSAG